MIVLVDYNLTGYVVLLQGTLAAEGWLDLLSIRFVTLQECENRYAQQTSAEAQADIVEDVVEREKKQIELGVESVGESGDRNNSGRL